MVRISWPLLLQFLLFFVKCVSCEFLNLTDVQHKKDEVVLQLFTKGDQGFLLVGREMRSLWDGLCLFIGLVGMLMTHTVVF